MGTATMNPTTEIVKVEGYTQDQIVLIRDTVAKGCNAQELTLFLTIARTKKLDPFTGQIRPIKRWDSRLGREAMAIQVGIDGYRVIASRTGEHMGTDDVVYDTEEEAFPGKATVTVYRLSNGQKVPYTATARWEEYVQMIKVKDRDSEQWIVGPMWKRMPYLMLGKVAESLALRKAFPDEMAGIYTFEEMAQADNPAEAVQQRTPRRPPVEDPRRVSEAQKVPAQPPVQEFRGVINETKVAQEGSLWLSLDTGDLVRVESAKIDGDMKKGSTIQFQGHKIKHPKVGTYVGLVSLVELTPPEAEFIFPGEEDGPPDNGKAVVEEMIASGQLKPAAEVDTPAKRGSIGPRREQRLYAIMTQSKAKNGNMTKEDVHHILSQLPIPLEHLRDLEMGMEAQFEKWMNGVEDWKAFLNDSEG